MGSFSLNDFTMQNCLCFILNECLQLGLTRQARKFANPLITFCAGVGGLNEMKLSQLSPELSPATLTQRSACRLKCNWDTRKGRTMWALVVTCSALGARKRNLLQLHYVDNTISFRGISLVCCPWVWRGRGNDSAVTWFCLFGFLFKSIM